MVARPNTPDQATKGGGVEATTYTLRGVARIRFATLRCIGYVGEHLPHEA